MILHYEFDDIETYVDCTTCADYEPHEKWGLATIDYDYEIEPTIDDLIEFYGPDNQIGWSQAQKQEYIDNLNPDFENDDDFIEYMKDLYYDDAREECQDNAR